MRRARSPIHGTGYLHPPVEPQFQPNSDMAAVQKLLTLLVGFLFLALGRMAHLMIKTACRHPCCGESTKQLEGSE